MAKIIRMKKKIEVGFVGEEEEVRFFLQGIFFFINKIYLHII